MNADHDRPRDPVHDTGDFVDRLAVVGERRDLRPGGVLCIEGDLGTDVYVVESGELLASIGVVCLMISTLTFAPAMLQLLPEKETASGHGKEGGDWIERLLERLASLEEHPHVAEVRGRGLLVAVELVRDRSTLEPFPKEDRLAGKVVGAGLSQDVFFSPGGCEPARDVIVLGPPFVVGEAEIDRMAEVLEASITSAIGRVEA